MAFTFASVNGEVIECKSCIHHIKHVLMLHLHVFMLHGIEMCTHAGICTVSISEKMACLT